MNRLDGATGVIEMGRQNRDTVAVWVDGGVAGSFTSCRGPVVVVIQVSSKVKHGPSRSLCHSSLYIVVLSVKIGRLIAC